MTEEAAATRDPVKATQTQQLVVTGAGSLITGAAASMLLNGALSPELADRVVAGLAGSGPWALAAVLVGVTLWSWGRRGYARVDEVQEARAEDRREFSALLAKVQADAAALFAKAQAEALAKFEKAGADAMERLERVQAQHLKFLQDAFREEPKP